MSKQSDVDREYCRMVRAAVAVGMDVRGWYYQKGSPSNGISYALATGMGGASDIVGLPSFGHVGKTAKEAAHYFAGMAAALESVAYMSRRAALPAAPPYTDPTTGEWVGEYATRDSEGSTHRQTEWFATESEALHFARTGQKGGQS